MRSHVGPIRLMGCPCVPLEDEDHAIRTLADFFDRRLGGYTVAVNAEKIIFYQSRPNVRDVIDAALLPYPDGIGAVIALKALHGVSSRKIDMPHAALEAAARNGWRTFVLGASDDVNRRGVEEIRRRHPNILIVGRLNGYEPEGEAIETIRRARPDLVMAALGSPRQELFAARLTAQVSGIIVVGCGGALDILSGEKSRAPTFMVDYGLEWLYRLFKEPSRWRRQLVLIVFLARLAREVVRVRLGPGRRP